MRRKEREAFVAENRILLVRTGSHLYGTTTAESDEDREGIFIPPASYVLGIDRLDHLDLSKEAKDDRGRNLPEAVDVSYYSLHKFVRQALQNNPNSLEPLFANEQNRIFTGTLGEELLEARHLFPSLQLVDRYLGYARSQRRKIRRKANRDPERAARRAGHVIRILRQGMELLHTGELRFPLRYADEIRAVKTGEQPLDEVLRLAADLEDRLKKAPSRSSLPPEPPSQQINDLTIRLVRKHLSV